MSDLDIVVIGFQPQGIKLSSTFPPGTDGHCKETDPGIILKLGSNHVDTFLSGNDVTLPIFGVSLKSTFQTR